VNFLAGFSGKRVWISGHTGFKGSWLTTWLIELGAEVSGFALSPPGPLFRQLGLTRLIRHEIGDIRNLSGVLRSLRSFRPDYVFHLAAQPLVRRSYHCSRETFEVNTQGTIHVLEALRVYARDCAAVLVTTDKVYENKENGQRYRETDPLGGRDPYSASKAAAEIAIASYRHSFFQNHPVRLASARAGNVIGGGDWAEDRIVPDAIRALSQRRTVLVRNPLATRPWQHVLEPLSGYLTLGAALARGSPLPNSGLRRSPKSGSRNHITHGSFNFGPNREANRTVAELVREILSHWPGRWKKNIQRDAPHEAGLLQLDNRLARDELGWGPCWKFPQTVRQTVDWYRAVQRRKGTPRELTRHQIAAYQAKMSQGD
jgi:CDP-glucose 4,6-dehydratase